MRSTANMKMKQFFVLFSLLLLVVTGVKAQDNSVGINTNTPNPNAVLHLVSPNSNQGFLVPRISTQNRIDMIPSLDGDDMGLIVFDNELFQFWHWDGNVWKAGLGILDAAEITDPNSDLEGSILAPTIKREAVAADELQDIGTAGEYGSENDSTILEVTVDENGRVVGVVEKGITIFSENIENGTILDEDIANGTITISKIDAENLTDQVLTIDASGVLTWVDRSAFTSSNLTSDNIYIGDGSDVAQGLPVGGDLTVTNDGTQANFQIEPDAVTADEIASGAVASDEILDEAIQSGDILNETILAEDIATGAVGTDEILDETILSTDIATNAVTSQEILDGDIQEIDIANGAITSQKIGDDAVTAAKVNADVAGEALIQSGGGALDVNAGNGLQITSDELEIDLEDIDGDGIVADLTNEELDVNVDDATLEVASDVVQVKDLGITNEKIAQRTINAEAKISNMNFNTGDPYTNRVMIVNEGSEVEWKTLGSSAVLATNASGVLGGKLLSDFATNDLAYGSIFVGNASSLATGLYVSDPLKIILGQGGNSVASVQLTGDMFITSTTGLTEIQDNAVQGDDIDATDNDLDISGVRPITLTSTGSTIGFTGNQGIQVDAENNDINLNAISGTVIIDGNQGMTLSTTANDIDIDAAGQVDIDGGTTIAIDGATGVAINSAANDVEITGNNNVDIVATGGDVTMNANNEVIVDAVNDIDMTSGSDIDLEATDSVQVDATDFTVVVGNDIDMTAADSASLDAGFARIGADSARISTTNDLILEAGGQVIISGGITLDDLDVDGQTDLDQTNIVTDDGAFDVSGTGGVSIDQTDNDVALSTTNTGNITANSVDDVTIDAGNDVLIDAGNVFSLTGDGASSVSTGTGTLTLEGGDDVDITGANDVNITGTAATVAIDGATGVSVAATTSGNVDIDAISGGIDIDAIDGDIALTTTTTGIVDIDGAEGVTINSTTNNVDITGAANTNISATTGNIALNAVAGNVTIDADGAVNLASAAVLTTVEGTLQVDQQADFDGNLDANSGLDVIGLLQADDNVILGADGSDVVTVNGTATFNNAVSTFNSGIDVAGGSLELATGGIQVNEIVDDATVDVVIAPSDNALVTESALASVTSGQAGSGLTFDLAGDDKIDLGGDLGAGATLGTNGFNFQVADDAAGTTNYLTIADGGALTIGDGAITTGDGTITTGTGQVTIGGNVDATSGLDITNGDLIVNDGVNDRFTVNNTTGSVAVNDGAGDVFTVDGDNGNTVISGTLDADGAVNLASAAVLTTVEGTLQVNQQADFDGNLDANSGLDVIGLLQADDNVILGADGSDVVTVNGTATFYNAVSTFNSGIDVAGGSLELATGGIQVNEIVDDATVDVVTAPSDNALVTESALASVTSGQAGSGLTFDLAGDDKIDLGGDLGAGATLGTNGFNFQVADDAVGTTNYLTIADGGALTIGDGAITTGDGTITTGTGQVTIGGNVDATSGLDITNGDLTVNDGVNDRFTVSNTTGSVAVNDGAGDVFTVDGDNGNTVISGTLDADGAVNLASAAVLTTVEGTLQVDQQADFDGNLDANSGLDVIGLLQADDNVILGADGSDVVTVNGTATFNNAVSTFNSGIDVAGGSLELATGGIQVNEIVDDATVDVVIAPSDNALVTESALASVTSGQAGSGLTFDLAGDDKIDLGGDLGAGATLGTNGFNFQVADDAAGTTNYLTIADGGALTIGDGAITTGDGTITTGTGQVTIGGNVDATSGLDITNGDLIVNDGVNDRFTVNNTTGSVAVNDGAGDVFTVDGDNGNTVISGTLDADGAVNLASAAVLTTVEGTLQVNQQADFDGNLDANSGLDVIGLLQADDNVILGADGSDVVTVNGTATFYNAVSTFNSGIDVAGGSLELATGGIQVNEIVDDATVDVVTAPSDNALVTESALASVTSGQAGSGLTFDLAGDDKIDLGGDLGAGATLGTNGFNFQVADDAVGTTNYLTIADGGALTIGDGAITTGDGTITTGTGQVTIGGNVDATSGLDITNGDLIVNDGVNDRFTVNNTTGSVAVNDGAGDVFTVDGDNGNTVISGTLDADGAVNLASAAVLTTVEGTLQVNQQADFDGNLDANSGLDVIGLLQADDNVILGADGSDVVTVNGTATFNNAVSTFNSGIDVAGGSLELATGGIQVNEIVDDATVDVVTAPSDNALVTESALASVTSGQAGSGLTFDLAGDDKIDLGGDLGAGATLGTNGFNFQVADDAVGTTNYLTIADGGALTIGDGAITTGDGTITTGTGQVTIGGNVDATSGLDITNGDLTVNDGVNDRFTVSNTTGSVAVNDGAGDVFTVDGDNGNTVIFGTLNVDGVTNLDQTNIVTNDGDLNVSGTQSISLTSSEDVADAITITADGGTTAGIVISNTTGTGAGSVQIGSTSGGVDIDGGTGVTINSTAINIGDDAVDGTINLGTGTTNGRSITIGNSTLATGIILNTGTSGITGTAILDEDNLSTNSDIHLATQQSIKAYVDTQVGNQDLQAAYEDGSTIVTNGTGGPIDISGDQTISIDGTGNSNLSATSGDLVLSTLISGTLDLDGVDGVTIDAGTNQDITLTTSGTGRVIIPLVDINGGTIDGITDLAITDGGTGASDANTARANLGLAIGTDVQAYDAGLASISGLTTSGNELIYTTGSDVYATSTITAAGLAILDDADASAQRTTLGIDIGSDIQAWDQALEDISGLGVTDGNIIVGDGTNWVAESGSTARSSLGLAIGTDVQAYDAGLASISGLTTSGNELIYTTGSDVYATSTITAAGLAILDDADASAQRTTLGIDIGSDIQAWDQALEDISGLGVTDGNIIVGDGTNWVAESGSTARSSLGLAIGTDVQAYDAGLASISGLTTSGNELIYTTGSDVYATSTITAAGLAILDDADASAQRTTLGIDIGSDIQAWDQALEDISGLGVTDGNIIVGDGTNWVAESGSTARSSLGLAIGTDVQAYDAGLASISGLTTSGNELIYTTGSDVYATSTITAAGLAILDDADASAQRTTLGIDIGSDIQAWDQALEDISGLGVTDGNIIVGDGTNWVAESGSTARSSLGLAIGTDVQAYDAGLASISGLTTSGNELIYTTGSDVYATSTITAAGLAILDDADASAQRTTLGIDIGSDIQAWDQALEDISGLGVTDGNIIVGDGTNWVAESGSTARSSLGLAIGTDVQAYDAGLASISGLTTSGNELIYTTGSDVYATSTITAAGLAILDDADASAQRTTLGIDIGSDIQAWDQALEDISGLGVTDGNIIVGDGTNWVAESGSTARSSLGLAIGTDVQAYDAGLSDIAGLTPTDGNFIVGDGSNWILETGATVRSSLGLGTIATQNANSVTVSGGAIDNTVIGGSTPAAGTFTTATATTLTDGTLSITGGDVTTIGTFDGVDVSDLSADVSDLVTLSGQAANTTNFGTVFSTGTVIPDGATITSALDALDIAVSGSTTPTLQQSYVAGETITTNLTEGPLTIAGDQTMNVSTSGGLNVTSLLDVDNIRVDGNTISSTSNNLELTGTTTLDISGSSGVTIDASTSGNVEINSAAGQINIGNDVVAQPINVGTGAAAKTISVGNVTGASTVNIDAGTGGSNFNAPTTNTSATTVGITGGLSVSSSAFSVNSGTVEITIQNRTTLSLSDTDAAGGGTLQITDGITDGQVLIIILAASANSNVNNVAVSLSDGALGNGVTTYLNNAWDPQANEIGSTLTLMWNATLGGWVELNRSIN